MAIPEEWIKAYVDQLLEAANRLSPGGFRDAIVSRADHAMDLVVAYRESQKATTQRR